MRGMTWLRGIMGRKVRVFARAAIVGIVATALLFRVMDPHLSQADTPPQEASWALAIASIKEASLEFIKEAGAKIGVTEVEIATIVAGFAAVKTLFDTLFGGFDGLNTHITNLMKLSTDSLTRMQQADIDHENQMSQARDYYNVAVMKTTATAQVSQWCFTQHATRVSEDMQVFKKAAARYFKNHDYGYTVDGKYYGALCANFTSGHATTEGKASGCGDGTQATVDRLRTGCALGALDRYDLQNTTIGGNSCDTTVAEAFGGTRSLGTNPEVIFMKSIYLPPGEESNSVSSSATDVGTRERLFQIQMYFCQQVRGQKSAVPTGAEVNTMGGASVTSSSMIAEAQGRNREQVCIETVMDNAALPCNDKAVAYSSFKDLCPSLKTFCTDMAKLMDVSIYPGCVDGSGSLSPAEVRDMRSRVCANPQASVNTASSGDSTPTMTVEMLRKCISDRDTKRQNAAGEKLRVKEILGLSEGASN